MSILVIGDVMADVYIEGVVNRISPEAPVPIFLEKTRRMFPGGAANVARNITSLGGYAHLVGVVGGDTLGVDLSQVLNNTGIGAHLVVANDRPTTRKTRYVASGQQLMRVDDESTSAISTETEETIRNIITLRLSKCKVVVVSDYGKGVITDRIMEDIVRQAAIYDIRVIVDPKGTDWKKYTLVDLIKPNADELAKATGMPTGTSDECNDAGEYVSRVFDIPNVLVTRADKGMLLLSEDGFCVEDPAQAREVYDVVGAGDTALAAVAVSLSEGDSYTRAMRFANMAAGIAVGRHGTVAVTREEVDNAFIGA